MGRVEKFNLTPDVTGERIKKYLSKGNRFDGRKPEEFRDIFVETGVSKNADGSARVKIGKTEVLVGVKMNVSTPYPDSPSSGNMMVSAEFLPLSSQRIESGPPGIESIELARVLDRVIRESKFIDLDKLCIKEGEVVWTVFIDIYTINDDGNLLDASGIGVVAALKNTKIPKYDEESERVLFGELTETKLPLKDYTPISITVYKINNSLVLDPTREEEDIADGRITIGGYNDIISSMQKGESGEISEEELLNAIELARTTWGKILSIIDSSVEKEK